eukprot:gene6310-11736_t
MAVAGDIGFKIEKLTALETIAGEKLTWNYVRDRLIHESDKIQNGSEQAGSNNSTQEALISSRGQDQKKPMDLKRLNATIARGKVTLRGIASKRKPIKRSRLTPNLRTRLKMYPGSLRKLL